jgi:hypothetical protein
MLLGLFLAKQRCVFQVPKSLGAPAKAVVVSKAVLVQGEGGSGVWSKIVGHGDTRRR